MVTIATFNDSGKAKHLKQRLQESGVSADIHNEAQMQKVMLSDSRANAKVMVHEKDFPRAQELVTEWESSDPDIKTAVRCPQCESPRIQYPQLARKFPFTPGLAAILFALGIFRRNSTARIATTPGLKNSRSNGSSAARTAAAIHPQPVGDGSRGTL